MANSRYLRGLLVTVLALAWGVSLGSPDAATPESSKQLAGMSNLAPPGSTISSPGVQISATNQGSSASVKIGPKASDVKLGKSYAHVGIWSVTASVPVSKSSDLTQLASLNGLANASTVTFDFFEFSDAMAPSEAEKQSARKAVCVRIKHDYDKLGAIGQQKARNEYNGADDLSCCNGPIYKDCGSTDFAAYDPGDGPVAEDLKTGLRPGGIFVGGSVQVGYQDFTFYDPDTLAQKTESKVPWSADPYIAWVPSFGFDSMILAKFEYQKAYKDANTKVVCDSPISSKSTCINGPIGPALNSDEKIASVSVRHLFFGPIPMGLSIEPQYDFTQRVFAVNAPLYLVPGSGGLTGGVEAGWRDDTHKFTFGLFVASAFSLIPSSNGGE